MASWPLHAHALVAGELSPEVPAPAPLAFGAATLKPGDGSIAPLRGTDMSAAVALPGRGRVRRVSLCVLAGAVGSMVLAGIAWGGSQTFTSSGTFTVPAGVYEVQAECWGGGGGGGGGASIFGLFGSGSGGGGGGGAFAERAMVPVTPGGTYTVTVGSGGSGGTGAPLGTSGIDGGDGGSGGSTSFTGNSAVGCLADGAAGRSGRKQ